MESALPATLHKLGEVGSRTGLSRSAIYREINAGHLKVGKIGRAVRVREIDLTDFIDALVKS